MENKERKIKMEPWGTSIFKEWTSKEKRLRKTVQRNSSEVKSMLEGDKC